MRTMFALTCVLAVALPAAAEDVSGPKTLLSVVETRKVADQAMALVKLEKFEEAYASVKPFWPLPPIEIDGLANQMRTQWPIVQQRYGKSIGTEFICEQKIGQSFVAYIYLQKFERHAIRWRFVFYRPNEAWMVNAVSWDDRVIELFN